MTATVRRGLQNIRTRSGATTDEQNPQRKFLRVANLELRKTLCNKVREAARVRVVEMDEQLAEIEDEQSRLLAAAHASRRVTPARAAAAGGAPETASGPAGLRLKY